MTAILWAYSNCLDTDCTQIATVCITHSVCYTAYTLGWKKFLFKQNFLSLCLKCGSSISPHLQSLIPWRKIWRTTVYAGPGLSVGKVASFEFQILVGWFALLLNLLVVKWYSNLLHRLTGVLTGVQTGDLTGDLPVAQCSKGVDSAQARSSTHPDTVVLSVRFAR